MNENDKQQRTFDDILLELMVQNETLDKIQTSALKVVDLLTPVADASKESLKEASETPATAQAQGLVQGGSDLSVLLQPLNGILLVAEELLTTMKSVEAGVVMLSDYSGLMRNALSIIANDLSATYNYLVESDRRKTSAQRTKDLQQQERDSEMMKLLARLGARPESKPTAPTAPKEDGLLAKLLGPLAIIGGLLAGFVAGVVGYFTKLFTGILSSLSKILGIGKFLSRIGLNGEFLAKLAAPFKEVFGKIKNFIKPVTDFIGDLFGKIGNLFSKGGSLGKIGEFFANMKNTLMKAIEPFLGSFKKFFGIGKLFGAIFGRLLIIFDVFKSVQAAFDKFGKTGDIGAALQTGVSELLGRVIGAPLDLLKSAVSWILGKFGFSEVESFLDSFSFTDIIQEFVGRLVDWGRQTFEMVFQTLVDVWGDIADKFSSGDVLGGVVEIFRGLAKYLLALPMDLVKNAIANVGEWFGADMGELRKFSFKSLLGGTNTITEAESTTSPQRSIVAASQERTAAKKIAEQAQTVTDKATEKTLGDPAKPEGEESGIWGLLKSAQDAFYKALEQNISGGQTQAKIGAVPSTVGSEMSALLSNTKDLENNSELAAAMIPSMSGGSGKKTTNVSAQSVTYNSNNIPDRTSWMTTPLANWSL
jgi:hypothetical protein